MTAMGGDGAGKRSRRADTGVVATVVLLVVGCYAALSVDVVRTGYGLKGDEATYVAMAFSMAHDGDLVYEARDIERFYQLYNSGPNGIHLKRGGDGRDDRLYFGKAFAYSVAAAPFVWVAGLNGMWVFHVVLLAGMLFLGYRFLAARSSEWLALTYTFGFFGVSIVPLYAVYLTSDLFNTACVFYAYFLWFYKEIAPRTDDDAFGGRLHGRWTDIVAAVLLGVAVFSKPTNVFLLAPPVLLAWWRRRFRAGLEMGLVCGGVGLAGLTTTALVMGELDTDLRLMEFVFIFQGGDRKIFYGTFPFERPGATFEALGIGQTTNTVGIGEERLGVVGFLRLLGTNLSYFLVGRHFGFVPFFFPGLVAVWLFLRRGAERTSWRWMILATAAGAAVFLAIYMPYSWSGGGGPAGNRYYLAYYPAFFFLTPALVGGGAALVGWLGGGLFTAHILINPFVSADRPYLSVERGMLRLLPVELTMVNDLPINLDAPRARIEYGEPRVLLYYLDHNAYPPEPTGIWIAARRRADIIVRSGPPLVDVTLTLMSPVANTVSVSMGGGNQEVELKPGVERDVTLVPDGVYSRRSWAYVLSLETEDGFVPRLVESGSGDSRYLGVAFTLASTFGQVGGQSLHGW